MDDIISPPIIDTSPSLDMGSPCPVSIWQPTASRSWSSFMPPIKVLRKVTEQSVPERPTLKKAGPKSLPTSPVKMQVSSSSGEMVPGKPQAPGVPHRPTLKTAGPKPLPTSTINIEVSPFTGELSPVEPQEPDVPKRPTLKQSNADPLPTPRIDAEVSSSTGELIPGEHIAAEVPQRPTLKLAVPGPQPTRPPNRLGLSSSEPLELIPTVVELDKTQGQQPGQPDFSTWEGRLPGLHGTEDGRFLELLRSLIKRGWGSGSSSGRGIQGKGFLGGEVSKPVHSSPDSAGLSRGSSIAKPGSYTAPQRGPSSGSSLEGLSGRKPGDSPKSSKTKAPSGSKSKSGSILKIPGGSIPGNKPKSGTTPMIPEGLTPTDKPTYKPHGHQTLENPRIINSDGQGFKNDNDNDNPQTPCLDPKGLSRARCGKPDAIFTILAAILVLLALPFLIWWCISHRKRFKNTRKPSHPDEEGAIELTPQTAHDAHLRGQLDLGRAISISHSSSKARRRRERSSGSSKTAKPAPYQSSEGSRSRSRSSRVESPVMCAARIGRSVSAPTVVDVERSLWRTNTIVARKMGPAERQDSCTGSSSSRETVLLNGDPFGLGDDEGPDPEEVADDGESWRGRRRQRSTDVSSEGPSSLSIVRGRDRDQDVLGDRGF